MRLVFRKKPPPVSEHPVRPPESVASPVDKDPEERQVIKESLALRALDAEL